MSWNQVRWLAGAVIILLMVALLVIFPNRAHHAEMQRMLDQADSDVAAAQAAAADAAASAARAKDAARDAQNRIPGSS